MHFNTRHVQVPINSLRGQISDLCIPQLFIHTWLTTGYIILMYPNVLLELAFTVCMKVIHACCGDLNENGPIASYI